MIIYIPDELMLSPAWCLANIPQLAELFKQDPFTRHSDYVRGSPKLELSRALPLLGYD